jgi:hypothetical protein
MDSRIGSSQSSTDSTTAEEKLTDKIWNRRAGAFTFPRFISLLATESWKNLSQPLLT